MTQLTCIDHKILKYLVDNHMLDISKISTECLVKKFHESVYRNVDKNTIIFLLENGANIHYNNEEILRIAMKTINYDLIKLLLQYGADPSVDNYSAFDEVRMWHTFDEKKMLELFTLFQTHGCIIRDIPCIIKILKEVILHNYVSVAKFVCDTGVNFSRLNTETDMTGPSEYNDMRILLKDNQVNDDIINFLQYEYKPADNFGEFEDLTKYMDAINEIYGLVLI